MSEREREQDVCDPLWGKDWHKQTRDLLCGKIGTNKQETEREERDGGQILL